MKTVTIFASALFLLSSALAQAHAHLKESQPAEGSILREMPATLVLKFSEAARLTGLTLQKAGESARKLGPLPEAAAPVISLPAQALSPGRYVITWRALGPDNHIMSGEIRFTIDPSAQASVGSSHQDQASPHE